ncbi:MsnO8 family LLM class oxidoreductase [Streptomyces tsukubensis]|uniref:Luciferase family oxidoreductase n=1 Tax=Streptomyces tsukubensis TaxID=83656 RepID=A0A1V4A215_9ACTN|nr:MsnO8 family LLM class oxidoreductase [Streptomyces tsukubensis]OON72736.1 luciferase family oxidoreductase [Streptomyces tsukubensis]QFR96832.1 MsnO8 family LLM class oxidoreductase [Streptomyces tsukubensis]
MSSLIAATRFSVLDRSRTREGLDGPRALRDTVAFARRIEELGYHRFWVSEHHSVPGVAGSSPAVLASAVASATSRIRVGTGGVMLPNHRPLVVAEQFGVLESLFPGRIDMGLGRSVGFTDGIRKALGHGKEDAEAFAEQLAELLGYFDGTQTAHRQVHAWPAEGLRVPAFVLATGKGARTAAEAGLPLVIANVRGEEPMLRAIDDYRATFRPSPGVAEPYVVLSGTVAVADTADEARRILLPEAWAGAWSRTRGEFPPLVPAAEIERRTMSERERGFFEEGLRGHLYGTRDEVAAALEKLLSRSGADEYLVTTSTYDRAAMLDSYGALAALAGLARPGGDPR